MLGPRNKSPLAGCGERTINSSLWPVSGKMAADMLSQLYDKTDESLPHARSRVQLPKINELRAQGESDHPVNRAGFIAVGDWR